MSREWGAGNREWGTRVKEVIYLPLHTSHSPLTTPNIFMRGSDAETKQRSFGFVGNSGADSGRRRRTRRRPDDPERRERDRSVRARQREQPSQPAQQERGACYS